MAVQTSWAGWYQLGLTPATTFTPADKKGILVWGGGGSVGTAAVQSAKLMGFTVYVTASVKHHDYLKTLGASRTFDYHDTNVVATIVKAARDDGITIDSAYFASGTVGPSVQILKELKGKGTAPSRIVSAPFQPLSMLWRKIVPKWKGTEVKFVTPPAEEGARLEFYTAVFLWLKEKLESGEYVPSPKIKVLTGGLAGIEKSLGEFKAGLSGEKLVLEL